MSTQDTGHMIHDYTHLFLIITGPFCAVTTGQSQVAVQRICLEMEN